jgi:hypothetical protein
LAVPQAPLERWRVWPSAGPAKEPHRESPQAIVADGFLAADAADFVAMSSRASDPEKRKLFGRLADELAIEVLELEQVVKAKGQTLGSRGADNVVIFKAWSGSD